MEGNKNILGKSEKNSLSNKSRCSLYRKIRFRNSIGTYGKIFVDNNTKDIQECQKYEVNINILTVGRRRA